MPEELKGRCLCGAVQYTLKPGFRMKPYACHCTDCQKRTGSAFSSNMLVVTDDLQLTGEVDEGEFVQPSGTTTTIGCPKCKSIIYAASSKRPGLAGLRVGTLENSSKIIPAAHLWTRSMQPWINIPDGVPSYDKGPQSDKEWLDILGPDQ